MEISLPLLITGILVTKSIVSPPVEERYCLPYQQQQVVDACDSERGEMKSRCYENAIKIFCPVTKR